ncbi:MAG: hypothetical protein QXH65_06625 [Thermofilaceae archaeon]
MAKKTVAVTEETYRILVELKQKMGCRTMDETVRRLAELSKKALAVEALEHVRSKRLSREEVEALAKLRERLREEGVWLRRS